VEKKQYELCYEILRRFDQHQLLDKIILIGSWSVVFYEHYFSPSKSIDHTSLRTKDIDFLVPRPSKIDKNIDVPKLVKDLGFVVTTNSSGLMRLEHPDLMLEFLVPERGAGQDKPVALPQLGMNAVALRFLNFLTDDLIRVRVEDLQVRIPHPINLALHKLIIAQRRRKRDKAEKDYRMAIELLNSLIAKGESAAIKRTYDSVPTPWKAKIRKGLDLLTDQNILAVLEPNLAQK
jgi:hypothetical protein